ncbi:MAG: type II toxin-antitoxin system HicB family antitoxin [Leptothrix sp. (in: b-proteobacteria)]
MSTVKTVQKVAPPHPFESYAHTVSPLSAEDGGGYLITFQDLPGCMSDGETMEEAIANGRDAFASWVSARIDAGQDIPHPSAARLMQSYSGKFIVRVPRSLHARLAQNASAEGVSLNQYVAGLLARG